MILHLTDTHLNTLNSVELNQFLEELNSLSLEALFITGDISNGKNLEAHLALIYEHLRIPIYFVLGNHDYYGKSFGYFHSDHRKIKYLEESEYPELFDNFALVGTDGWYDSYWQVPVIPLVYLLDWLSIKNIRKHYRTTDLVKFFREFAWNKTEVLRPKLEAALLERDQVVVLTHFPPIFVEGSSLWTNAFWKPYDVNNSMRDLLLQMGTKYPNKRILVLCGHTHEPSVTNLLPNVQIIIGHASVGKNQGVDVMSAMEKFNETAEKMEKELEKVNQPATPPSVVARAAEAVKDAAFEATEVAQDAGKTVVTAAKEAATAVGVGIVATPGHLKKLPEHLKKLPGATVDVSKNLAVNAGKTVVTVKDRAVEGAQGVFSTVRGWFKKSEQPAPEAKPSEDEQGNSGKSEDRDGAHLG